MSAPVGRAASDDWASAAGGARSAEPAAVGGAGAAAAAASRPAADGGGVDKLGDAFISDVEAFKEWDDMGLPEDLQRGINRVGFESPTPIQQRAIVPMRKGLDVLAQAQAGSGKTGAFCAGLLSRVDTTLKELQGLVLAPTIELASQIADVMRDFGAVMGATVHLCVGGTKVGEDKAALRAGVHVVVGTLGRVVQLVEHNALQQSRLRVLVLDEADEMLKSDKVKDLKYLMNNEHNRPPSSMQIACFSATLPESTMGLLGEMLRKDAVKILVEPEKLTFHNLKQYRKTVRNDDERLDFLTKVYDTLSIQQSILYANSRTRVDTLSEALRKDGHSVSSIHSGLERSERARVMKEFRAGATRVLVSSDLLGRGIDIPTVSLVVNVDVPAGDRLCEAYLHRIGRSTRLARKGVAITFITAGKREDEAAMSSIEEFYHIAVPELPDAGIPREDLRNAGEAF